MKLKLSIALLFVTYSFCAIGKKPVSGKNEKAFAVALVKFLQGFDKPADELIDQYTNYDEYMKMLVQAVPDPENEIRQRAQKANPESWKNYTTSKIERVKATVQNENLEWKNANGGRMEETKQYENGFLRRGYIHFKIGSRKVRIRLGYCFYNQRFYLLSLKRPMVVYQKEYEEPIAFSTQLWDKLPPEFPAGRKFYYPDMKSFQSDESTSNVTVTSSNSPLADSILNHHKTPGNSTIQSMVDLQKDSLFTAKIQILSEKETLFHSTATYTLRKYLMDEAPVWIPVKFEYAELKSDSVVYMVSSKPNASLREGYLFFTCKLDVNFGQYSRAKLAHNGARVTASINTYILCQPNELSVEMTCEDMNEDFANGILKSIFQSEGDLEFKLSDHTGNLVTNEHPSEKMPVRFRTSEPIDIKINRD